MNRAVTAPARQQGYATILTMLLFAAMALAVFSMYDVGQVTSDKIRLQNTADAAAYSTANMLARDFNFIAYTNRAMIANQAAIGQMVGLASWSSFLEQEATNLDAVASIIPVVGTILKPITTAVKQATVVVHQAVDASAALIINVNNQIIAGLSRAQGSYHNLTLLIAVSTLQEVVKANDPDVDMGLATAIGAGATFMNAWKKHLGLQRPELLGGAFDRQFTRARFGEFSDLVRDSRDGFTTRRQNTWLSMSFPTLIKFSIEKHGATDFEMYDASGSSRLAWDWTSMDTESLWTSTWRWSKMRWRRSKERLPIGWGAAHALDTSKSSSLYNYAGCGSGFCFGGPDRQRWGDGAWRNRKAATLAGVMDGANRVARSDGLKEYYDFAKDKDPKYNNKLKPGDTSITPGLLIYLSKPTDKIRTRRTIADNSSGFELSERLGERLDVEQHGGLAKQRLAALAKAESYFSRPATLWPKASIASWHGKSKYNGRQEHGNMFNPYWQVRLIEPTQAEWLAATAYSGASLSGL